MKDVPELPLDFCATCLRLEQLPGPTCAQKEIAALSRRTPNSDFRYLPATLTDPDEIWGCFRMAGSYLRVT